MKNWGKFLIVIIIEIMAIVTVVTLKNEVLNDTVFVREFKTLDNVYIADSNDILITKVDDLKVKTPKDYLTKRYYGGEEKTDVFSYSFYTKTLKEGDTLEFSKLACDQILILFRNSYPMVSLEEMGVSSEKEAYQALQLAIWEVADRTGESLYSAEEARIESLRAYIGEANINKRVFESASKLVHFVENWDPNDKEHSDVQAYLHLYTNNAFKTLQNVGGKYLAGPFKYKIENGMPVDALVQGIDSDGNNVKIDIYDENGKLVTNFLNVHNENFYVAFPKENTNFNLKINVKFYHMQAFVYNYKNTDYVVRGYNEFEKEGTLPIKVINEEV